MPSVLKLPIAISFLVSSLTSLTVISLPADDLFPVGKRVVFLGDSNTYAGSFVATLDALLYRNGKATEIINVGLPSETCCGLSEPDHPFPRPTVQERIDRVLEKTRPDLVFACYGMNDGIYHPFSQDRFESYQSGIRELIAKVKRSGAKLILLTPPPFDALPMKKKGKLVDQNSDKFAWFLIYEDYDSVLQKYSQWLLTLDSEVDAVIDIRTPIEQFLRDRRKTDPDFTMSDDGVHFNVQCHRLIAEAIIRSLFDSPRLDIDREIVSLASRKMEILRDAWLTETRHKRPGMKPGLPLADAQKKAKEIDQKILAAISAGAGK